MIDVLDRSHLAKQNITNAYNIHRWYKSSGGRYTQTDPVGIVSGDGNLYAYVQGNPIAHADPTGLITIKQGFQKLGGSFGGGGDYNLGYGKVYANGKCVCENSKYYIRLTVMFVHGYYCTGSGACATELHHANIASAYVSKALVTQWGPLEQKPYSDKASCEAAAEYYAYDLKKNFLNKSYWPDDLVKSYNLAQQNYEDTHWEGPCLFDEFIPFFECAH